MTEANRGFRQAPELLAPAGDWECLRAAAANGADAVYFGLEDFNARRRASNFALANLAEVLGYLHDRNVRGYVTFNTLIFSDELPRAAEFAAAIAEAGADAVIVQDLGLIRLIRRLAPTLPVHASTQMTQTEAGGIELLGGLGVSRVILARELTLAEIAEIARATPMPLEVFVHGAMCISYSGQCLASEVLWGRSANRGQCAQACRLPYQMLVDGRPADLGDREYLLSATDLAAYDRIAPLVEMGVAGFKIEGRLKSAHYVASATRVYRAAVDAAAEKRPFAVSAAQQEELAQSFSRGQSHGFLDGVDHRTLVHGRFPKHRGVLVGRVTATTANGTIVELADVAGRAAGTGPTAEGDWPVKPGDGVVFDEGHPEQDEQGGRVYGVRGVAGPEVAGAGGSGRRARPGRRSSAAADKRSQPSVLIELTFRRGDVNLAALAVGSRVWKTDDPAIRRRLAASFRRDRVVRRAALHAAVEVRPGQPLVVRLADEQGAAARVESDEPPTAAEKHPLTRELIHEQFGRLGNTPFELATVELRGPEGPVDSAPVLVPKSVLNDLRRRAVAVLLEQRMARRRHAVADRGALDALRRDSRESAGSGPSGGVDRPVLHVLVRDPAQLEAVLGWAPPAAIAAGVIYGDFADPGDGRRAVEIGRRAGRQIGLATPRVMMPEEETIRADMAAMAPAAVLVRNLGDVAFWRARFPQQVLVGDQSLNAANEIAMAQALASGLARITPAADLNWAQLREAAGWCGAGALEVVVHQHVPMFHTRHCLLAASGGAGGDCGDCGQPCRKHAVQLRDRMGQVHPVRTDGGGRNTVFNRFAQSAAELVAAMQAGGFRHFRVESLGESREQVQGLLELYGRLIAGELDDTEAQRKLSTLMPGGVDRGTWARG